MRTRCASTELRDRWWRIVAERGTAHQQKDGVGCASQRDETGVHAQDGGEEEGEGREQHHGGGDGEREELVALADGIAAFAERVRKHDHHRRPQHQEDRRNELHR
jgi:hypothetical protein